MGISRLNQNGQVTIPAKIRKNLQMKVGDPVQIEEGPQGRIILTPVTMVQKPQSREALLRKYEAEGVDVGALLSNLEKTPTERVEENKRKLELIEKFKKGQFKPK